MYVRSRRALFPSLSHSMQWLTPHLQPPPIEQPTERPRVVLEYLSEEAQHTHSSHFQAAAKALCAAKSNNGVRSGEGGNVVIVLDVPLLLHVNAKKERNSNLRERKTAVSAARNPAEECRPAACRSNKRSLWLGNRAPRSKSALPTNSEKSAEKE